MKKITLVALLALTTLSSCSSETNLGCPTYSSAHKTKKHGGRVQSKYAKKNTKKHAWI